MKKVVIICLIAVAFLTSCIDSNANFQVNQFQCSGCAKCQAVCPSDAIRIMDATAIIDPTKCTRCGNCVDACPEYAIY